MKKLLFFLLRNLHFIRRINSVLIFLAFLVGNFLFVYTLISDQEFISGCLILILPGAYLLSELLLLSLYYAITILEQCHELDLEQINFKQPVVYLKKRRLVKNRFDVYIGNLLFFWDKEPVFLGVQHLIKSKFIGLIISLIMIMSWPIFYEYPLWIISGMVIFILLYSKLQIENLAINE